MHRDWLICCLLPLGCTFAFFWLEYVAQTSFLLDAFSALPLREVDEHAAAVSEASPAAPGPVTFFPEHQTGPSDAEVHAVLGRSILDPLDYVNNKWLRMISDIQSDCARRTNTFDLYGGDFAGFGAAILHIGLAMRKALLHGNRTRIKGHIGTYSRIEYCNKVLGETQYNYCSFTCFFEPISSCLDGQSKVQQNVSQAAEEAIAYLKTLQNQTNSFEMATDLYQALNAYTYRMNPRTLAMVRERSMKVGFDETASHPLVALHIRRGDKIIDKYNRYHTIREYVRPLYSYAAKAAVCNSGSELVTMQVYVASDSLIAFPEVDRHLKHTQAGNCRFQVIGETGTLSQKKGSAHVEMVRTMLTLNAEDRLEATLEIIFDIYMLSRATFFVGTFFSEPGRLARGIHRMVNYPNVVGPPPVALDYNVAVAKMGAWLPGGWVQHPAEDDSYDYAPGALPPRPSILSWDFEEVYQAILAVQGDCGADEIALPNPTVEEGSTISSIIRKSARLASSHFRKGIRVSAAHIFDGYAKDGCEELSGVQHCLFRKRSPCHSPTDVNRIPKLSVKTALEIFGRTSELDLLSVVEAWLLNLNEEGYSHILQNPAYDRWVMEKLPIVALKAAVVPSYENHVEAIQAWAKAKFHAGEAAAREVELPHESLSGQELAKGMKKTNLDAILLLIAGNTSSREEVNRLSMVLDRQVGGPLRFGAQKELVDVAANSNHSMAGSITTIYLYTIADVFFGSWSTCSDGDLLLAELRHANLGKASGPVAFLVDDPIDQPPACKEETMLFSDLWATFPVPKT
mmetsp:Transcript_4063/g.9645  ORF Transcript_4063/g.9645 Transcript_4063/m.9645 type:complete len:797 (+) Transcript_4063:44-2434(+)